MPIITKVIGREIIDSRGNPTVEAEVLLDSGSAGGELLSLQALRQAAMRPWS